MRISKTLASTTKSLKVVPIFLQERDSLYAFAEPSSEETRS